MTQEEALVEFKRFGRFIGSYCLFVLIFTFVWAATAPNGHDTGIHVFLGIVMMLLWFLPFAVVILGWLLLEFQKWPVKMTKEHDDTI